MKDDGLELIIVEKKLTGLFDLQHTRQPHHTSALDGNTVSDIMVGWKGQQQHVLMLRNNMAGASLVECLANIISSQGQQ